MVIWCQRSLLVASYRKHSANVLLFPCLALTGFLSPFFLLFFPFVLQSMDQSYSNYLRLVILTSNWPFYTKWASPALSIKQHCLNSKVLNGWGDNYCVNKVNYSNNWWNESLPFLHRVAYEYWKMPSIIPHLIPTRYVRCIFSINCKVKIMFYVSVRFLFRRILSYTKISKILVTS